MRKLTAITQLVTSLAIAGALAACSETGTATAANARTVVVERVQQSDAFGARFSGAVRASNRSDLAFEIGGQITGVFVELGDRFERGDVLARLDTKTLELELSGRRADLANARAVLVDAQLDYDRRAGLAGTGAVSQAAIDQARSRYDSANAEVLALAATVAQAEENLADARLLAPFDGEVAARLREPSEVVAGGAAVLSVIGVDASLEAVIHVPGPVRRVLDTGTTARITARGEESPIPGRVTEVGTQANPAGLFPVTVAIDSTPDWLRPGESIEARLEERTDAHGGRPTLRIPVTAFVPNADNTATVYVVDAAVQPTVALARRVRLGALSNDGVEVLEGLRLGEIVVVKGAALLADGQAVDPVGIGLARYNR